MPVLMRFPQPCWINTLVILICLATVGVWTLSWVLTKLRVPAATTRWVSAAFAVLLIAGVPIMDECVFCCAWFGRYFCWYCSCP